MKGSKKIVFLPVNQAWVVVHDGLMLNVEGRKLYNKKEEIVEALGREGFRVRPNGLVESKREIP